MKVKIAIIAGLFMACASVLRAQDAPQSGQYMDDPVIPAASVMYESDDSTPGAIFLMPVDQSFSAWAEVPANAAGVEHPATGNANSLLLLFQQEAKIVSDHERESSVIINPAGSETIFLDPAAISDLRYWLEESADQTNNTSGGVGGSNRIQVLFIEPLNAHEPGVSGETLMPEVEYRIIHSQPDWYEWIHPKLVLAQWVDFWTHETNATPVVLVLFTF